MGIICGTFVSSHVILYFFAGLDQSTQVRDEFTMEEKGKNKKLEYMLYDAYKMMVCGVLTFIT